MDDTVRIYIEDDTLFTLILFGMLLGALTLCVVRQAHYIEKLERRISYAPITGTRSRYHFSKHQEAETGRVSDETSGSNRVSEGGENKEEDKVEPSHDHGRYRG